ncbi:MAG: ABC transporter permease [Bdellovibrio sp.]
MKRQLPALFSFIVLTVTFEFLVKKNIISASLFPAPSDVLRTLHELRSDYLQAFMETLRNVLAGLGLSLIIGGSTALIFSVSEFLKRAILPFAIFFQTVPIIAIAPLLVIYFGFGSPTIIAASFIVSVFPIIANTLIGLESASEAQKDLFKIYHASPVKILFKLKIPSAYSYIYSGIKIASGLSIIGAIAGEFVGGGGLGAMIDSARTQQRVDIVFGALLLLSVMGLFFLTVLGIVHRALLLKRPYASSSQE